MDNFLQSVWSVMLSLSPSLLIGVAVAGLLHILVPPGLIGRVLSGGGLRGVLTAAAVGVPMPLCSCGVIPTALSLRKEGASEGATVSFLISTPQTGVDSILVTSTFLGWPFTFFKLGAAFLTGTVGGLLADRFGKKNLPAQPADHAPAKVKRTPGEALRYGVLEILGSIDYWIILGVIISALLTVFVPPGYLASLPWVQGLPGMLLVLAISVPLYVCTTGSVPIAAGLVAAGMPLGTALVFLMAGPATNVATIGAIYRTLGGRILAVYLGVITVFSMAFGLFFGSLLPAGGHVDHHAHHAAVDPLATGAAILVSVLLVGLVSRRLWRLFRARRPVIATEGLKVTGMTCNNCVAHVEEAVSKIDGVTGARADLASGALEIRGRLPERETLRRVVQEAGYGLE